MSHGCVYQLEPDPIDDSTCLTECDANDTPFSVNIANWYVLVDSRDKADRIIREYFSKYSTEEHPLVRFVLDEGGAVTSVIFEEGFQQAFFHDGYIAFLCSLEVLRAKFNELSYADGSIHKELTDLTWAYEFPFGDYVFHCGEFITFDEFARHLQPGKLYYFGNVLDYHY